MNEAAKTPEERLTALFDGLTRIERLALLGSLEIAGGRLYRALAASEKNLKAREALLKAAEDEERNGQFLRLMSTPKNECEKCKRPLSSNKDGFSCSFQCTFCESCTAALALVCPNCGGDLESRQRLVGVAG